MARDFNQNRNTNAKLGSGTVVGYGNHWSLVDELDGWNKVYVGTPNLPSNIKEYLEGNTTLSVYATPQNIDKLHQYAFAGFPNLVDLYLLKEEEIVELDDNFLGGVSGLQHIYVPSDLLGDSSTQDTYLGEYNGKTFASLFTAIPSVLEWTITPSEIGSDTLTDENFNAYISTLTDRIKNAVGQLNLNEFTNGVGFAWSYDFSNVFPSLEDIYVDNVKVDFSTFIIQDTTQDHILTASVVSTSVNSIPTSKLTMIEKIIVPIDFTSYASGSITELQAFMNTNSIDKLVTTYEAGAMELSLSGDIVAKIVSIGKTLDEALVHAKQGVLDANTIIVPPTNNLTFDIYGWLRYSNYLVYIDKVSGTGGTLGSFITGCPNLIRVKEVTFTTQVTGFSNPIIQSTSLKQLNLVFTQGTTGNSTINIYSQNLNPLLVDIKLNGFQSLLIYKVYTDVTRDSLMVLINSLGIPSSQESLVIGQTNINKLTQSDIDFALSKNWNIVAN